MRTVLAFVAALVLAGGSWYVATVVSERAWSWDNVPLSSGQRVVLATSSWLVAAWPLVSMALIPAVVGLVAAAGPWSNRDAYQSRRDRLRALACWTGIASSSGLLLTGILRLPHQPGEVRDWVVVAMVLLASTAPTALVAMVTYAALVQREMRRAGLSQFGALEVVAAVGFFMLPSMLPFVPGALNSALAAIPSAYIWWRARRSTGVENGG